MRWLRSWPAVIPAGRAYVVDGMERLVLSDYDYTPLAEIDEDVCLLEWDMAVERVDRERFETYALRAPERVLVAPYHLYGMTGLDGRPVQAHRRVDAEGRERWVWLKDRECDYFGFGCIYLPRQLVRAFLAAEAPARGRSPFLLPSQGYTDSRMHDQTFSIWHRHYGPQRPVEIAWDVRAVHLHD